MITDPLFYALAVPAILITGISKSGFGGAMGGLAVPLMSLAIPPADAVGIMLPILCTMDIVGLRRFAGSFDWPNLRIILPGALVGIALGTLCFGLLNKGWLLLLVGTIGVGFPLLNWSGLARRQHPGAVAHPAMRQRRTILDDHDALALDQCLVLHTDRRRGLDDRCERVDTADAGAHQVDVTASS